MYHAGMAHDLLLYDHLSLKSMLDKIVRTLKPARKSWLTLVVNSALLFNTILYGIFKNMRLENYNLTFFKVLPQRIKHIRSVPGVPEIFYDPTGKEPCPRPLGEDHGMVVFDYMPTSPVNYFR